MKKFFLAALLSCTASIACFAQENGTAIRQEDAAAQPVTGISGTQLSAGLFSEAIAPKTFSVPFSAEAAKPEPRVVPRREDYDHWQLGFGYNYFRLRTTAIAANMNGFQTSLARMMDDRFGIEASVGAGFGPLVPVPGNVNMNVKLLTYMGGARYAWPKEKWELWAHGLAGGAHLRPNSNSGGNSSFAYAAGGGADYHLKTGISIRMQGNLVGTRFFGQNQYNIQIAAGILFHF
jgi:opacity protein-like surface antigen